MGLFGRIAALRRLPRGPPWAARRALHFSQIASFALLPIYEMSSRNIIYFSNSCRRLEAALSYASRFTASFPSSARHEPHCGRIHAITQTGRLRPIIEHMTEMGIAKTAGNRIALHAVAVIDCFDDIERRDRLPEARPAGARFEVRLRIL